MGIRDVASGRTDAYPFDPEKLVIVGRDTDDQDQLSLFNGTRSNLDGFISEEMIQSVMDVGVIQPIVVAWRNKRVEVVDGERRTLALREGNKRLIKHGHAPKTILGVVKGGSDADLVEAMMIANEHRLENPPSIKAENIVRYLEVTGKTEKQAAASFGVTRQTINNYTRVNKCCDEVKKALDEKKVRMNDILTFHKLDQQGQLEELQKIIKKRKEECEGYGDGDGGSNGAGGDGGNGDGGGGGSDWNKDGNVTMRKPRKNVIDKVIELCTETDEFEGKLSDEVIATLKWVTGAGEASAVPGLTDVLAHIDT